MATERERLAVVEVQLLKLMGNGQPGIIAGIWRRLEVHSKMLYTGLGVIIALQAVTAAIVSLVAAGVIRIR